MKVTHLPTGLFSIHCIHRSQHENRAAALSMLKELVLAAGVNLEEVRHPLDSEITSEQALNQLKSAFKRDPSYAHSWHCNIACCAMDAGVDDVVANDVATRFMFHAFGVKNYEPDKNRRKEKLEE